MGEYTPPFSVSAKAIRLVADISALVERYAIRLEAADGLLLRKANRIKTIRSSLAIEGNDLSEDEVRTLMDGKTVIAPKQQLQEVFNAIRAYEESPAWDAYQVDDMLKAHGCMMQGLCPEPGRFRKKFGIKFGIKFPDYRLIELPWPQGERYPHYVRTKSFLSERRYP